MKRLLFNILILVSLLYSNSELKLSFDRGEYQKAIDIAIELLKEDSNNIEALRVRANSYKAVGEFSKANADFEQLFSLDDPLSKDINFLIERGKYLYSIDDETFITFFEEVLKQQPENIEVLTSFIDYYNRRKDFNVSIDYLLKLYHINNSIKTALKIATTYYKVEDYINASTYYSKVIEKSKPNPSLYYNRAVAYLKYGKRDDAKNDLLRVIDLDPNNYKALNSLGDIEVVNKDMDKAISYYSRSIKIKPSYYTTYYKRSKPYIYKKQLKEAAFDLREYLTLGKDRVKDKKKIEELITQLGY